MSVPIYKNEIGDGLEEGPEDVRIVVRGHVLEEGGDSLKPHAPERIWIRNHRCFEVDPGWP